ncbi:imidazole glycerol phosphate synthase subunit HisH [Falsibacillus albus]|uniref:Imidazole glycerol phosphate synthase subunit HisH n=1 Tax=Falsibacillus albus TaxID=2478915 RepID=A0A3L7K0U7_9BACI|nr:imidazole glycerol phosphate synthase subunit HisH [Falsibacillus albus]RLQ96693.1 imidazole glycerol phosphate synthase subunit HisH [Falsibacillus albus]
MIGIIDYGMGNLFSVGKALERLNVPYLISDDPDTLKQADGLILPGVGSFYDAMALLREKGLLDLILDYAKSDRPLLGICLGMQLLFDASEENGFSEGLGLLKGKVKAIPPQGKGGESYKVPHMGWNKLRFQKRSVLLDGLEEDHVYFVHSYFVDEMEREDLAASAEYNVEIPAVVSKGNVYGMQFHPEKSSRLGMSLLKNFTGMVYEKESLR